MTHNASVGVSADSNGSGFGKVRISGSTVTNNAVGLQQSGTGILESRGANTIEGNGADTSGTVTSFPAK